MSLEEHSVEDASGEYSRRVWLWKGPEHEPHKLCVFLDAEYYLYQMDVLSLLSDLQTREIIPPVTCLFVSNVNGAARQSDYTCNARYSRFIAHDLFHWARSKSDAISEHDNLLCGLSLSGLGSAYLALTYPDLFSSALCQSGSFWWNSEWLTGQMNSWPSIRGQFWISVGDKEVEAGVSHPPTGMFQGISQIAAATNIARKLELSGATVNYQLFSGGHEIAPWKKELPSALRWLIGKKEPVRVPSPVENEEILYGR